MAQDVVDLVTKSVSQETSQLIRSPRSVDRSQARQRDVALDRWRKSKYPMSYEEDILASLITAINPVRNNVTSTFELGRPAQGGKPLSFFVESIIKHSSASRCRPPFISKGSFRRIFKIAVVECRKMYIRHQYDAQQVDEIIIGLVTRIACEQRISHIPWVRDQIPGASGRPSNAILHTIWLPLGETEHPRVQPNSTAPVSQSQQIVAIRTSQRIAMDDPRSRWSACSIRLTHFHKILHKHSLPTEWGLENAADEFQTSVYDWVSRNYDPLSNPLHAMSMFVALIFAGLLPKIYLGEVSTPSDIKDIYQTVRSSPFVEKVNKKGSSRLDPFITMVSGFIIAMMDSGSPLGVALTQQRLGSADTHNKRNVTNFFNKHSKGSHACRMLSLIAWPVSPSSIKGDQRHKCPRSIRTCDPPVEESVQSGHMDERRHASRESRHTGSMGHSQNSPSA